MCVFNIRVFDADAESYYGKLPYKVLSYTKRHKKGKYIETFPEIQQHFKKLFLSVWGGGGGYKYGN